MKKIDLECPICLKKKDYEVVYEDSLGNEKPDIGYDYLNKNFSKTYRYVKCGNCYHVFASPIFKGIENTYEETLDPVYLKNSNNRKLAYHKICKDIQKKYSKKINLLDFGCATGDFLEVAKLYFDKVEGLEISKYYSEIAISKKLTIHNEDLQTFAFKNKKYDIITMWGVIEHLERPDEIIKLLKNLLNEDGIVYLWTGDFHSIYSKLLKKNWWYVIGQHIQLFSFSSLCKIFSNNSFNLEKKEFYPYVFSNHYLDFHLRRYKIYKYFFRIFFIPFLILNFNITIRLSSELMLSFRLVK